MLFLGGDFMSEGKIITLSGMSGVGKSFLIKQLLERTQNFEKLKAVTTRKKRENEIDGVDKYFVSFEDFQKSYDNGELCVVNEVFGNMYGYYKRDFEKTKQGINLITELYYSEIPEFKQNHPNTISIYVVPSDVAITIDNLSERNSSAEELEKRLLDINKELESFSQLDKECFDFILINNYREDSIDCFNKYLSSIINFELNEHPVSMPIINHLSNDIKKIVDGYALDKSKTIVYTSFDGDDMHYLSDICKNVIEQGKVPLNPEAALGYYVSTTSLGGVKQEVMKDCLTLEMLADELYVYRNHDYDISEGIIAEIILWNLMKNNGLSFVGDVKSLENYDLKGMDASELEKWILLQDSLLKKELNYNLLDGYMKTKHKSNYVIANFRNFKHIDWARTYNYNNGICPISPQNILPYTLYKNDNIEYLKARLELLRRTDEATLFIDRFNKVDELNGLDDFSKAELYYLKMYLPNKPFKIIGWDEIGVPKYDKNKKWALTTKEDLEIRRLIKRRN